MGREAECDGKTKYATKAKAIERMEYQMCDRRRRKRKGSRIAKQAKMEVYHCPHCHQWHVGATINRDTVLKRERLAKFISRIDQSLRGVRNVRL